MDEPRNGTGTPIRELFADADRIAELEHRLSDAETLLGELAIGYASLAVTRRNDVRLSAVLRGIEQRLRKIELGGEVMP